MITLLDYLSLYSIRSYKQEKSKISDYLCLQFYVSISSNFYLKHNRIYKVTHYYNKGCQQRHQEHGLFRRIGKGKRPRDCSSNPLGYTDGSRTERYSSLALPLLGERLLLELELLRLLFQCNYSYPHLLPTQLMFKTLSLHTRSCFILNTSCTDIDKSRSFLYPIPLDHKWLSYATYDNVSLC